MPALYKTPGVYVEEIPKFPPSIAPVETAIPAFIGYTEKATRNGESLLKKPVRIESIAEYEEIFGGGPPQTMEVYLDNDNGFIGAKKSAGFLIYDSLRMFYSNGGGNCYIVSIGSYTDTIQKQPLLDGVKKIEDEDEPTILLFPDAVNLPNNELYDVQIEALSQCNKLKDRVTLCDVKYTGTFGTDVQTLRNNVGINNLKYGAAYGPWIITSLPRTVSRRDLTLKRNNTSGAVIDLKTLTTDETILQILFDISKAEAAVDSLKSSETAAVGAGKKWEDGLKAKSDAYNASADTTLAALEDELRGLYDLLAKLLAGISTMVAGLPAIVPASPSPAANQTKDLLLKSDIDQYIASAKLKDMFDIVAAHYNYLKVTNAVKISTFTDNPDTAGTDLAKAIALLGYANSAAFKAVTIPAVTAAYTAAATEKAKADLACTAALNASGAIIAFYRFAQKSAAEYEKKFNDSLLNSFGTYKSIISKATEFLNLLPPSGAIAGVYAAVDRDRGVWKAPANVSLNAVISPAVKISHEQQAEYNVDVNAGKSINIIRSFPGKGVLVWGARTLAGNDNEWRYVNVRRFFNFVEESVKKATEQFVFEPNDANTWVRIQAMIENFLTVLWRQGALQGIKPEHAFYVAVGLGKTMTPLDILEGRLIVEIGMAAVRPAEFIILKFSHKMAES
ncbi:MAG: phage tail protein [Chlorobiales bacterium]|nr:phage tail protein [Chlorobiales bacterium]